jgi:formylglycine-generating enzyme required for sulfatase activity
LYPVTGIGWDDAGLFCEWSRKRLPTEAEWEKACRGPGGNIFPWGEKWDHTRANTGFAQNLNWPSTFDEGWVLLKESPRSYDFPGLNPVGDYFDGASFYHVFDLVGNTSEWVSDWYNWNGYWDLPSVNPFGSRPEWNHSLRGSAWFDRRGQEVGIAEGIRCAARSSSHSFDDPRVGFRCAR